MVLSRPARRTATLEAATRLAAAASIDEVCATVVDAAAILGSATDHIVLAEIDADKYTVLGGTSSTVRGVTGNIQEHPILAALGDLTVPTSIGRRDRRHPGVGAVLRAARARWMDHVPLVDGDRLIGCATVLRRRRRPAPGLSTVLAHATAGIARIRTAEAASAAADDRRAAAEAMVSLTATMRVLDGAVTADEVRGIVLGSIRELDRRVIGAVVGVVDDGVVADVAAIGTTPRQVVDSLSGTRLDGFPIGQQMLSRPDPVVAGLADVSLATRTKIMEPIGAQTLLAAGGRDAGAVRIVLSCYRSVATPPQPWTLGAIECVLDHAAVVVGRLERELVLGAVGAHAGRAIVIATAGGTIRYANDDAQDVLGRDLDGVPYESVDGRLLEPAALPWARASAGVRVDGELLRRRSTGRIHRVTAVPVGGALCVVAVTDVTDEVDERAVVTDLERRRADRDA